jgi:hypothetical protein
LANYFAAEAALAADVAALPAAEAAFMAASTAALAEVAAEEAAAAADGASAGAGTTTTEGAGAGAATSSFLLQAARATAATMAAKTRDLFILRSLMIFKKTISGNCQNPSSNQNSSYVLTCGKRTRALSTQP